MVGPHYEDALVVGAGVSGLTTALVLAEADLPVKVVADRPPEATTSAIAGASWGPYLVGHDRILGWSSVSRAVLTRMAEEYGSGVHMMSGVEAYDRMDEIPQWAKEVSDFRNCEPAEVPQGYGGAWHYTIPLVDMPVYLRFLSRRLERLGVDIEIIPSLERLPDAVESRTVVNCTGLGARQLVGDSTMAPIRGQLTIVENPGITEFFQDNVDGEEMTCIFPHGDHVVLGGISQHDDVSQEPNAEQAAGILSRCVQIEPRLAGARVIGHRVGMRPQRPQIRVERDQARTDVIHNYGHGGSGVTLSWGCAMEVLKLFRAR